MHIVFLIQIRVVGKVKSLQQFKPFSPVIKSGTVVERIQCYSFLLLFIFNRSKKRSQCHCCPTIFIRGSSFELSLV